LKRVNLSIGKPICTKSTIQLKRKRDKREEYNAKGECPIEHVMLFEKKRGVSQKSGAFPSHASFWEGLAPGCGAQKKNPKYQKNEKIQNSFISCIMHLLKQKIHFFKFIHLIYQKKISNKNSFFNLIHSFIHSCMDIYFFPSCLIRLSPLTLKSREKYSRQWAK